MTKAGVFVVGALHYDIIVDAPHRPLLGGDDALDAYMARIDELDISCFRCED